MSPLHKASKLRPLFVSGSRTTLHVSSPWPFFNGSEITSVQESEHDGGDHCGTTLEARSTANHCGGTARLSDWRAWAVELGSFEINGFVVPVPVRTPCQFWRGVVRVERS